MYYFPDLSQWFDIKCYHEINECRKIEVNMKVLQDYEIERFCKEFAMHIVKLRCPNEVLCETMVAAINGTIVLDENEKRILQDVFFVGFISEKNYRETNHYQNSFDDDSIKGYFGECFYYILRDQIFEDEKKYIEPKIPKKSSKVSGIDFVDIRKDVNGYYMIIGEIKTTGNGYSSRLNEIIESFIKRADRNFSEMYQSIKENDDETDKEYSEFVKDMLSIFYKISGTESKKKRVAGAINYNYEGKEIGKNAFGGVKDKLGNYVEDSAICRRFKLIGIYNVENVIRQVRDIIWNVL